MTGFAVVLDGPASLRASIVPKDAPRTIATKLTAIPGIVRSPRLVAGPSSMCTRIVRKRGCCSFTRSSNGCATALRVAPSRILEALLGALRVAPSRLMEALMVTKQGTRSASGSLAAQWIICTGALRLVSSRMLDAMT